MAKESAAAPATTDRATLDVSALLRHVVDVESSLPPPRREQEHAGVGPSCRGSAAHTCSSIDTNPEVRILQLPRHDRRRDEVDFDDEDVDLFVIAARTSRVVGAGLVTVSRQSANNSGIGGIGMDFGPLSVDADFDVDAAADDAGENVHDGDESHSSGYGDMNDPMGGDRYGPVTICCAYCEDDDDDGNDEGVKNDEDDAADGEDDELDEMITCLSILALRDSSSSPSSASPPSSSSSSIGGGDGNHNVTIVLGTSFGRVLSTELCVHHGRGIRRADIGGEGGEGHGDPFEPLPLDYDNEDVLYEYYDEDGRRHPHGGGGEGGGGEEPNGQGDGSSHSAGGGGGGATAEGHNHRFFHPEGGIKSIEVHVDREQGFPRRSPSTLLPASCSMVSVAYGDGTCVRLPHYALFKSVVTTLNENPSVKIPIRRCKVNGFPWNGSNGTDGSSADIVFLPKSHPSLLAPPLPGMASSSLLSTSRPDSPSPTSDGDSAEAMDVDAACQDEDGVEKEQQNVDMAGENDDSDGDDNDYDFCEAVTYGCSGDALTFHSSSTGPPPLFPPGDDNAQSSEQSPDEGGVQLGMVTGAVVGVAAGVFGAAMGAVSWGLGGGGKSTEDRHEEDKAIDESAQVTKDDEMEPEDALFRLRERPVDDLTSAVSIIDPPRKLSSVVIDPGGDLAATTDTLGRVLLIELESKQVLRIWKGVRDASCCWIQIPRPPHLARWGKKNQLYLAIHSRQRRVVEVWRVRHGPRVGMHSVGRDARLVPCLGSASEGALARCFILEPSSSGGASNMMDSLTIHDPELHPSAMQVSTKASGGVDGSTSGTASTHQKTILAQSTTGDAMQLQLLKQQLASETNVPSSPKAIYDTLTQIGSIADLSSALDLLSTAEHLEVGLGVQGSSFHSHAVEYCEKRLESASNAYSNNPHLRTLKMKIVYHKQIISAYNALNKFESKHPGTGEDGKGRSGSSTAWAIEALAWIETYEAVMGHSVAETMPQTNQAPLKFSKFAKTCMQLTAKDIAIAERDQQGAEDNKPIHLLDSKRDRTIVLLRIFRPLLMDIFVFKVVNTIFQSLAITQDHAILQQYFGEWFMALSGKLEGKKDLMVRWLQEMVARILDEEEKDSDGVKKHEILLDGLYRFCSSSDDLPRAFLLATICLEAVSAATQQKEAKTYGKISSADEVMPWEQLLRKLRVCLLITLRLSGVHLGSFPVNISNIDDGSIFSIYQWIARDELSISHKHHELVSLEDSCRTSLQAFDPSSVEGDPPARWGLLQMVCRDEPNKRREKASRSFDNKDQPGPLLLYLGGYNHPVQLAAHRALLLGEKWGKDPHSIDFIKDAVSALRSLGDGGEQNYLIAAAVRLELWQTRIRPVYRALLFGFEDVPELSEDIMAPLCQSFDWISELGRVALDVLTLIAQTPSPTTDSNTTAAAESISEGGQGTAAATTAAGLAIKSIIGSADDENNDKDTEARNNFWPTSKDDVILRSLVSRAQPVASTSLDVHRAIVCAAKLTDDLPSLSYCVPTFSDVFLQGSLFCDMSAPTEFNEHQEEFLNDVVLNKALQAEGQIDHFELEEIENLGLAWGVERTRLRAQFLLHMYDVGKDHMVFDFLANLSSLQLDFPLFVEGGLEIACARLHSIIVELKKTKMFRSIVGMLDADTCKWVKKEAEEAADHLIMSTVHDDSDGEDEWQMPPLSSTHALVLKLLRMSSSIGDAESTEKAHSLSILSGTLLNAVKENEELKEYGFAWAS